MKFKSIILFLVLLTSLNMAFSSENRHKHKQKYKNREKLAKVKSNKKKNREKVIEHTKIDSSKIKLKNGLAIDSLKLFDLKLKFLKKNAHASYYANKFNGRRTASGKSFNNNGYTAAHKKLPFGTKVKVTNETNGKSVIVEITDRGPFSKVREIDLSKKAFMDIASNKSSGVVIVTLEEIETK